MTRAKPHRNPTRRRGRPSLRDQGIDGQDLGLQDDGAARNEAKSIFGMVGSIETLESARALIGISPRVLSVLRSVGGYSKAIQFRRKVLAEFDALVERSRA